MCPIKLSPGRFAPNTSRRMRKTFRRYKYHGRYQTARFVGGEACSVVSTIWRGNVSVDLLVCHTISVWWTRTPWLAFEPTLRREQKPALPTPDRVVRTLGSSLQTCITSSRVVTGQCYRQLQNLGAVCRALAPLLRWAPNTFLLRCFNHATSRVYGGRGMRGGALHVLHIFTWSFAAWNST